MKTSDHHGACAHVRNGAPIKTVVHHRSSLDSAGELDTRTDLCVICSAAIVVALNRIETSQAAGPPTDYPKDWPRCAVCKEAVFDGKATCGSDYCDHIAARRESEG